MQELNLLMLHLLWADENGKKVFLTTPNSQELVLSEIINNKSDKSIANSQLNEWTRKHTLVGYMLETYSGR